LTTPLPVPGIFGEGQSIMTNKTYAHKLKTRRRSMFKQVFNIMVLAVLLVLASCLGGPIQAEKKGPVPEFIRILEVGKPLSYRNLTIVPVYFSKSQDKTEYITLEDALKQNWIEITEMEGGRVPQVRITNNSKHMIYLMGGEILTGCKQDRILAGDILLAPGTKDLLVPVFCVEQGRWNFTSANFYSKENLGTFKLRSAAQTKAPSAQSEIWNQIASENRKMGVASDSSAYQAAYDKEENKAEIARIEQTFQNVPHLYEDTTGVIIGLAGRIVSADIFANEDLFKKQWPKILKSSALSSISCNLAGSITQKEAVELLQKFFDLNYTQKPGLDLGIEYTYTDQSLNISSLIHKNKVVHLAGFPQENERTDVIQESGRDERVKVIK